MKKKEGGYYSALPKELYPEYLEKHKIIPLNWFTKLILKLRWFKYKVKHYKVKNPIFVMLNQEVSIWNLLPKHKWLFDIAKSTRKKRKGELRKVLKNEKRRT